MAVCPPTVNLYEGGTYRSSRQQRWLWGRFLEFRDRVGEARQRAGGPLVILLNGELADDNRHSKFALVSLNPETQLANAVETLKPLVELLGEGDGLFVTRGTEAHSGPEAWMDEKIAADLGATPSLVDRDKDRVIHSHWWLKLNVDGVRIEAAHHPPIGPGRRPWTRSGFAATLAKMRFDEYVERDLKPPHLSLFGHVHWPGDSYDAYRTRAIVTPSWQLGTAFSHRLGGTFPYPVGGVIVTCDRGRMEPGPVKHYWEWQTEGYRIV